jgi:soluble lytic murein transglycosylase-like protein
MTDIDPEFPNSNPARDVFPEPPEAKVPEQPAEDIVWAAPDTPRGEVDRLIAKYAAYYEVPESLVRRVVKRESNFNPKARNGPYWGLMQILPQTARGMGYQGVAQGLLDAETNLKYAVKYLRGAYLTAEGNHDQAVRFYARGYYYDAKRRGLLEETGLGKDRKRRRQSV